MVQRMVQTCLLLALLWKVSFFAQAIRIYWSIPLDDPFFPAWLRSAWTIGIAYLSTIGAIALSLLTSSRRVWIACGMIALGGETILCLHQGSYNDMTFVTAWWTSLWALWFSHRLAAADIAADSLLRRAALLSRMIVSVILLGGAVGKWTAEYWSGEVLYDIYFLDRDFWIFNLLRGHCSPESLVAIARWYSRAVVVIETVAGFGLWLLPPRWAATIGVILLASIALLSNFLLFSVLLSLMGLAAVGWFVRPSSS
jgi:hypothetical protein